MSKAAWCTLGLAATFTGSLIYLVHRQQRVEKKAMRAGIDAEDEKRADAVNEAAEARKRIEKNRIEYELQQNLTNELMNKATEQEHEAKKKN